MTDRTAKGREPKRCEECGDPIFHLDLGTWCAQCDPDADGLRACEQDAYAAGFDAGSRDAYDDGYEAPEHGDLADQKDGHALYYGERLRDGSRRVYDSTRPGGPCIGRLMPEVAPCTRHTFIHYAKLRAAGKPVPDWFIDLQEGSA